MQKEKVAQKQPGVGEGRAGKRRSARIVSSACALPRSAISSSFVQTLKLHLSLMRCSDVTSWKGNRSAH